MFVKLLEKLFGLTALKSVTDPAQAAASDDHTMFETVVDTLGIHMDITDADRDRIPQKGPVIVVANHPMGGIDGLLLGKLLHATKRDWRVLSHVWFGRYPELAKYMILVDPRHETQDRKSNSKAMKEAVRWVRRGGMLALFPSGKAATRRRMSGSVTEAPWRSNLARLVRMTRATVLPVHISGHNSWVFQIGSAIHPWLGVALLVREVLNKRGKRFRVRVGEPIAYDSFPHTDDPRSTSSYLRAATLRLGMNSDGEAPPKPRFSIGGFNLESLRRIRLPEFRRS